MDVDLDGGAALHMNTNTKTKTTGRVTARVKGRANPNTNTTITTSRLVQTDPVQNQCTQFNQHRLALLRAEDSKFRGALNMSKSG